MNHLAPAPDDADENAGERYLLPQHAHIVVYERDASDGVDRDADGSDGVDRDVDTTGGEGAGASQLVTIYDCGAAQKPPSAQLLGELGSVRAACETTENPTGYVVSMREPSVLVDQGEGHYVVRSR
ncbi:hypothetical protein [Halorubellus litoreus]|uniref:Halobacterial output domain-containing protein n=1 Tax=Halorubellus litoreus TaxID=755308 RepID=A0ABD5VEH4_9EURY